jgi:hypothetical protein
MLPRNEPQPRENARKFFSPPTGPTAESSEVQACGVNRFAFPFVWPEHSPPNQRFIPENIMRKFTSTLLFASAALFAATSLTAQTAAPAPAPKAATKALGGRASPHDIVNVRLGGARTSTLVVLSYGRPYAKGRTVWGELVKWDAADRLGADEATTLLTEVPITLGGVDLQPGAYTLYIVPSQNGVSKLGISTHVGKWGIPVDVNKDIARVDLKKDTLADAVEQLTLGFEKPADGASMIKISWANTLFTVPIALKK